MLATLTTLVLTCIAYFDAAIRLQIDPMLGTVNKTDRVLSAGRLLIPAPLVASFLASFRPRGGTLLGALLALLSFTEMTAFMVMFAYAYPCLRLCKAGFYGSLGTL